MYNITSKKPKKFAVYHSICRPYRGVELLFPARSSRGKVNLLYFEVYILKPQSTERVASKNYIESQHSDRLCPPPTKSNETIDFREMHHVPNVPRFPRITWHQITHFFAQRDRSTVQWVTETSQTIPNVVVRLAQSSQRTRKQPLCRREYLCVKWRITTLKVDLRWCRADRVCEKLSELWCKLFWFDAKY